MLFNRQCLRVFNINVTNLQKRIFKISTSCQLWREHKVGKEEASANCQSKWSTTIIVKKKKKVKRLLWSFSFPRWQTVALVAHLHTWWDISKNLQRKQRHCRKRRLWKNMLFTDDVPVNSVTTDLRAPPSSLSFRLQDHINEKNDLHMYVAVTPVLINGGRRLLLFTMMMWKTQNHKARWRLSWQTSFVALDRSSVFASSRVYKFQNVCCQLRKLCAFISLFVLFRLIFHGGITTTGGAHILTRCHKTACECVGGISHVRYSTEAEIKTAPCYSRRLLQSTHLCGT